jgi:predicted amino acid racemase
MGSADIGRGAHFCYGGGSSVTYPVIDVNLGVIRENAKIVRNLCLSHGIAPAAAVKGFGGIPEIMDVLVDEGYDMLASSRIPHLASIRERGYPVKTLGLRIPMPSEAELVVRYCDISLNSDVDVIRMLDSEARRAGKIHKVILMRDLGDLREGIFDSERFVRAAHDVDKNFPNIELYGIGANLSCYGSVKPSVENMSELAANARMIEGVIGRKLEVVSGGASTSLPMLCRGVMPGGINHLRVGAALMHRCEIYGLADGELAELSDMSLVLRAEVIETGAKPTYPSGELAYDCFGNVGHYEDRGVRRRALLAVGAFDIGGADKLVPLDEGAMILGCSSDHMIVDVEDSSQEYRVGDAMSFRMMYQSMLFAAANEMVGKNFSG